MLTFEEWRHTYADVFETDDAARAAWTAACNRGYRTGMQDTRALLAAHSAGAARVPVETAQPWRVVNDSLIGRGLALQRPFVLKRGDMECYCPDGRLKRWKSETEAQRACNRLNTGRADELEALKADNARLLDSLTKESNARCEAEDKLAAMTDAARHLSNLLARIHRDGGHYEAEHGTDKAVADADDKVARLITQTDAARDVVEAARIVLGAGLAKDISGNGVKVFVTSVSAAERLSAANAEIERIDRAKGE